MDKLNVRIETLTNENYPIWAMQIEALLDSKDLFEDVISQDEPIKNEKDENSIKLHAEWSKKNREAYSLLILTISPNLAIIFKGVKNAKKIWCALKERFEGEIEDKIMNLYLQLSKLTKHNHESVDQYMIRAQGLTTEITQLGKEITERELVRYIVEGLSGKFNDITTSLIANRGITLSQLRHILVDYEKKITESKKDNSAFRTKENKNKRCFICNKIGHLKIQCWFNATNKNNFLT